MIADKVDTNNDGVISKEELMVWITHIARRFVVSYVGSAILPKTLFGIF